jgi:hypothetical protein
MSSSELRAASRIDQQNAVPNPIATAVASLSIVITAACQGADVPTNALGGRLEIVNVDGPPVSVILAGRDVLGPVSCGSKIEVVSAKILAGQSFPLKVEFLRPSKEKFAEATVADLAVDHIVIVRGGGVLEGPAMGASWGGSPTYPCPGR